MNSIPENTWSRRLDAKEPDGAIHTFSRPPMVEALSLLPIAYRVGTYIHNERSHGGEPIFDLSGLLLEPPKPGPHAGVPLGGLGGGCIGRGFKGEFRRWSLDPGRYVHRVISADVFSIRVKRGDNIYTKVLSVDKGSAHSPSPLSHWDWNMPADCATYHALYPRSWTVYKNPVPDITVVIEQVSPFLPGSYSEASLPCAVFHVEVTNTSTASDAEVSVMFTFQNGYDGGSSCTACGTSESHGCCTCGSSKPSGHPHAKSRDCDGGLAHCDFRLTGSTEAPLCAAAQGQSSKPDDQMEEIAGVCMTHPAPALPYSGPPHCTCRPATATTTTAAAATAAAATATTAGDADRSPEALTTSASETADSMDSPLPESPLPAIEPAESAEHTERCAFCAQCHTGIGSFAIASSIPSASSSDMKPSILLPRPVLSTCAQFVTETVPAAGGGHLFDYLCGTRDPDHIQDAHRDLHASARQLWASFSTSGDINEIHDSVGASGDDPAQRNVSLPGTHVGGAVCLRQWLARASASSTIASADSTESKKVFPFALSWDNPYVRFGNPTTEAHSTVLPRFYTKFLGTSGVSAPSLAAYALLHAHDWRHRIEAWQRATLQASHNIHLHAQEGASTTQAPPSDDFYGHMLFNELYFLADGGTVWTDSTAGINNQPHSHSRGDREGHAVRVEAEEERVVHTRGGGGWCYTGTAERGSEGDLMQPLHDTRTNALSDRTGRIGSRRGLTHAQLQARLSTLHVRQLHALQRAMHAHDRTAQASNGAQSVVGQFLYLEGHEYLMYNTYDVHFYSSFALVMLWPQLQLSLQRDFARAVSMEDSSPRVMMGTGDVRPRKVKGVVPHDLGSPSEQPWVQTNAYNFQDVSRWKDLGPKFVLQVYRDYQYLRAAGVKRAAAANSGSDGSDGNGGNCSGSKGENTDADRAASATAFIDGIDAFLRDLYPVLLVVMQSTEQFDTDGDGMIENSGFPDQTYDIWTATGVHAYCGGLWIAACEAMSAAASIMSDTPAALYYRDLAHKARAIYLQKLWNGRYLNYDSSTSPHHDSIMADMLAGQWYAHACALPPVLPPRIALSCLTTIYQHNVVDFGQGKLIGAVNGTRPPVEYDTKPGKPVSAPDHTDGNSGSGSGSGSGGSAGADSSTALSPTTTTPSSVPLCAPIVLPAVSVAQVDNSCMQSREVWTGTTYALAAAMIQEAQHSVRSSHGTTSAEINTDLSSHIDSPAVLDTPLSSFTADARTTPNSTPTPLNKQLLSQHTLHSETQLTPAERALLLEMAQSTAQGVHDGGWQQFGYWFATPEGWERNGNYRSLGYMRALGIWAMQFAKEQR